jgi:transposase
MDTILTTAELQQQIESLTARVAEQDVSIAKMKALIEYYERQILLNKRRLFGASSEKTETDIRQMNLFGEITETVLPEPETIEVTYTRGKRKGKREEDLSGLPVERIDHERPEGERDCPQCGETMNDIGVDVRKELKLIPAQVVVVEHAAHVCACAHCQKNSDNTPIIKADAPKPLISGSLASPSLVAHIITQKYSNGMPLYRIEKGFQYDGAAVSRQTMANWVIQCAETYLLTLYILLKTYLLKETLLHADETIFQVLREPNREAQTQSYEWVYRTSGYSEHPIVVYDYQETRSKEHPQAFLKDFQGFLHTDGYPVYHNLPPGIVIVGCWAHARRYFENLLKTLPKDKREGSDAYRGVAYINHLFELEREFKNDSPEERFKKRLEKSKPIADAFFVWVAQLGALPKSPLGQAAHYALSQRVYLENVFLDGRLELSNNRCERSVKPFVIGRKNWLFSNTPTGAYASSILYSIIETAKENGLRPHRYIEYLLESLLNATTHQVEAFLPWSPTIPDSCRVPVKASSVAKRK